MSDDYERLEREHGSSSARKPRDLTALFAQRQPLADAPAGVLDAVGRFAASKRLSLDGLEALGTRYLVERGGAVVLVWGYDAPNGQTCAVKYRHLGTGKRWNEPGSKFLRPKVLGNPLSTDWLVAEGETDGARLHELTAGRCAVLVMPAGAAVFRREWAGAIPRDAVVYLMLDGDRSGDDGARKAARVIGGRTVRVTPPKPATDWCDWDGDTDALRRLVREKRAEAASRVRTFNEVLMDYGRSRASEELEPIRLGFGSLDADLRGVSAGQLLGIAARTAVGKTWLMGSVLNNLAAHPSLGVLVLSLEMPAEEWAERQVAIATGLAPEQVEAAAREERLDEILGDSLERLQHAVICEDALALHELPGVFSDARSRLAVPLRLVMLDYLGLVGAEGKSDYERTSALGRGLKQLAKAELVALVVAMQLSRAGGDGSRPVTLEMLRDSGVLEESCDFVLGAWRPDKDPNLTPAERDALRDMMRVALLKNRKGRDGLIVELHFQPGSRRLYEPAEEWAP
jgi:DnaB-like helicase C terminal domain